MVQKHQKYELQGTVSPQP